MLTSVDCEISGDLRPERGSWKVQGMTRVPIRFFMFGPMAAIEEGPRKGNSSALEKLIRMLRSTSRHRGTHVTLAFAAALALSFYASRRAAERALRQKAIEALLQRSRTVSRVQSAISLSALAEPTPAQAEIIIKQSSSMVNLQHLCGGGSGSGSRPMSRKPSELALAELTSKVCERCLSRCATHESLTRLDEDDEQLGRSSEADAAAPPADDTTSSASVCSATTPTRAAAAATTRETVAGAAVVAANASGHICCASHRCEVCAEVDGSLTRVVKRALQLSLGGALAYVLWLRFVASKATVRTHMFALTRVFGRLFFEYRVVGGASIPEAGPALITCYHGFVPVDMYFLHEWVHRHTGRVPTSLVADFVFRIPFFGYLCRACGGVPASRTRALEALKAGGLVIVAPGGVREAMTSSAEDYVLRWYGKQGFAEIAAAARVPIIPMFTRNVREVFLVLGGSLPLIQRLYKHTRLPFTPFVGPLPMPLTSVLGAPIPHVDGRAASEVAHLVRESLQSLMVRHLLS